MTMASLSSSSSSSSSAMSAFLALTFLLIVGMASAQLSDSTFYNSRCPSALSTIRAGVDSAISNYPRTGASLLRLHFHDCFVQGCDASLLLDRGEKNAPASASSLRSFDVIDTIKFKLEMACPGVVSCADILAVAARDSVVALGGPTWAVQLGRRDSATAATIAAVNSNLPAPTMDLSALITFFSNKGLTAAEMVALSGGHTIGQARCTQFRNRIYNETNIDAAFATTRQATCPFSGGDNNLADFDATTPTSFDNAYFTNLMNQRGLLHSDQELFNGGPTDAQVRAYSTNGAAFMEDFANAMIKLGTLSPLTGTSGQIRTRCRRAN